jgi:endonuclease III
MAIKKRTSSRSADSTRIFELLHSLWPDAHCELEHYNAFQLLVAVVLSAQATDVSVNKSFGAYVRKNPDFGPADLLALGERKFLNVIRTIGLAPTKAKNCLLLSKRIVEAFGGEVPRQREDLESLAGVGRKTASVVLNVLYGEPTMAVDTHVARLAVRLGLAPPGSNREEIEVALIRQVPDLLAHTAHHALIFHGRYLCSARKPRCSECALVSICPRIGVTD